MKQLCWNGSSDRTFHVRSAIDENGNVVARNYNSKPGGKGSLKDGDIGVSVRVDFKTDDLTSEQREAMQSVVAEMTKLFNERLGIDVDKDEGPFAPGTVVVLPTQHKDRMWSDYGCVTSRNEHGLFVQAVDSYVSPQRVGSYWRDLSKWRVIDRFIPFGNQLSDVPGYCGLMGLMAYMLTEGRVFVACRYNSVSMCMMIVSRCIGAGVRNSEEQLRLLKYLASCPCNRDLFGLLTLDLSRRDLKKVERWYSQESEYDDQLKRRFAQADGTVQPVAHDCAD